MAYESGKCCGSAEAMADLGYAYWNGYEGVSKDDKSAFDWLLKAALNGKTDVFGYVGAAYFRGKGVQQDYQEAIKWFDLALREWI